MNLAGRMVYARLEKRESSEVVGEKQKTNF